VRLFNQIKLLYLCFDKIILYDNNVFQISDGQNWLLRILYDLGRPYLLKKKFDNAIS